VVDDRVRQPRRRRWQPLDGRRASHTMRSSATGARPWSATLSRAAEVLC